MRHPALIPLLLPALAVGAWTPSRAAAQSETLQLLGRSSQLSVRARPDLYALPDRPDRCGVLLVLTNETSAAIGIDLRDYWAAAYPSQWVFTPDPRREIMDEPSRALVPLSAGDSQAMRRDYRAGRLTTLRPGAGLAVFSLFNGPCPDPVAPPGRRYLILPIVGVVRSTDGRTVAEVRFTDRPAGERDVVVPLPAVPRRLPRGVRLLLPPGA